MACAACAATIIYASETLRVCYAGKPRIVEMQLTAHPAYWLRAAICSAPGILRSPPLAYAADII